MARRQRGRAGSPVRVRAAAELLRVVAIGTGLHGRRQGSLIVNRAWGITATVGLARIPRSWRFATGSEWPSTHPPQSCPRCSIVRGENQLLGEKHIRLAPPAGDRYCPRTVLRNSIHQSKLASIHSLIERKPGSLDGYPLLRFDGTVSLFDPLCPSRDCRSLWRPSRLPRDPEPRCAHVGTNKVPLSRRRVVSGSTKRILPLPEREAPRRQLVH